MRVLDLSEVQSGSALKADLVIVGGGPAGLTIARELFESGLDVLIIESGGVAESAEGDTLNEVESTGDPSTPAQVAKRQEFHGANARFWSPERQPYGVRCRGLGGSSAAWAGKSAPFSPVDFEKRDWVPYSGWPVTRAELEPHMVRAASHLNLGPNIHDDRLWAQIGCKPPQPALDPAVLGSFFWQFARSRIDQLDILRFGPEFLRAEASNVRVLVNATVVRILLNSDRRAFAGVEIAARSGARHTVSARAAVIAASGIENPRLLLASGIGGDATGRFLMDHPSARVARLKGPAATAMARRFGFYSLTHSGRTHMYSHGLEPTKEAQQQAGMLNGALFFMEERALDDPWDALKRVLKGQSKHVLADVSAVAGSPALLAKGLGMKVLQNGATPKALKELIVNTTIMMNPTFAAREFQSRGLPHKITGLSVEAISEQAPDPDSRITLSDRVDAYGIPLARVDWRIGALARRTLGLLSRQLVEEFQKAGLPAPTPEDWVARGAWDEAVIIDMAHTIGATRMSDSPKDGVVDANCKVHGVADLYVAGSSVFPTSGHANPTLMIATLAIRLADRLRAELKVRPALEIAS